MHILCVDVGSCFSNVATAFFANAAMAGTPQSRLYGGIRLLTREALYTDLEGESLVVMDEV